MYRWAPWLGDHMCHVLLFRPLLSERQGALRPTPCRPGAVHAGLVAPRRPAPGASGHRERWESHAEPPLSPEAHSPRKPPIRIKAGLLFLKHSCHGRHVIWGPLATTAQMSHLGTPPRPSTHEHWGLASDLPSRGFKSRAAHPHHVRVMDRTQGPQHCVCTQPGWTSGHTGRTETGRTRQLT